MNRLLDGRVVLVTGGASGIGRAICAVAARQGAALVIAADLQSKPRQGGEPVEALVRAAGADFQFVTADVTRVDEVEAAVAVADRCGGLDLMVCNAGLLGFEDDSMMIAPERLALLLDVNVKGVFFTAQAAARQMIARGRSGSIVLMSSMGGIRGAAQTVTYSATKAAVKHYAASMAAALGVHNIRVNAVCPGLIETGAVPPSFAEPFEALRRRTPLARVGTPEEIADVVVWLGSAQASFVNGTSVVADGGLSAVL